MKRSYRALYISDAHLGRHNEASQTRLVELLDRLAPTLDDVFYLGDIFEFWVSYRSVVFSHFLPFLAAMQRLRDRGVAQHFFAGNHDFAFLPGFEELTGARLYPEPARLERAGVQLYLCHGDQINRNDRAYLRLRRLLHHPWTHALIRLLPPDWAWALAERFAHASRRHTFGRPLPAGVYADFLGNVAEGGVDVVLHGHTHVAGLERFATPDAPPEGGMVVGNCGEWLSGCHYIVQEDRRFQLFQYPDRRLVELEAALPLVSAGG